MDGRVSTTQTLDVRSPFDGSVLATLPQADETSVASALAVAEQATREMAALPAHERAGILHRAADLVDADQAGLARVITAEQGKHTADAQAEASRAGGILRLCAEEAQRVGGELLPMDAAPQSVGRLGYVRLEPAGIVVAISPFNYPAILSLHKIGPALAAGNAAILKPASTTPLTALFLADCLVKGGLPEGALQVVVGPGAVIGHSLVADPRVRRVTFTGSPEVGEALARAAGAKRIAAMELGSNAAMVVLADADLQRAARSAVRSGFTNAGQNCVSTQRIIVERSALDEFMNTLLTEVAVLRLGDPSEPSTTLAPMTDEREARRVMNWVDEAVEHGAALLHGGERDRTLVEPLVILEPPTTTRVWREELFGPGVVVHAVADEGAALAAANDTRFGLAASIMTRDVDRALRFADALGAGIVNINPPRGSTWRSDFMPWGGRGESGFGHEGVKYAVSELSEPKLVVWHPGASE